MERQIEHQASLDTLASEIIAYAGQHRVWLFEGQMGAGKTTLIKAICARMRVLDQVSSPTFSIVNEYRTNTGERIYHFDFYRIKSEAEAVDIGCVEYLDSGDFCFIEWAGKIPSLLPEHLLIISIEITENKGRYVKVSTL